MNLSYLNNIWLLIKIALPSILCVLLLDLEDNFWGLQFVVIFGLIIIPFNIKKLRNHLIGSLLLSIVLSFLVLFLSMGVGSAINYFINDLIGIKAKGDVSILNMQVNDITFFASVGIISPLLMFYGYGFLFKIERTNYFTYIKWISIIILVLLAMTNLLSSKNNSIPISWQLVMTLALQLILYKDELKSMLKIQN